MSARASGLLFAELWKSFDSLEASRRTGSDLTSEHTSFNKCEVRSRMLLWRWIMYPPRWQDKACSVENFALHAHRSGMCFMFHAYLKYTASKNSCLFKAKFSSFNGKVDSQMEAPSDLAILFDFCWIDVMSARRPSRIFWFLSLAFDFNYFVIVGRFCSGSSSDCEIILTFKSLVNFELASYSTAEDSTTLTMPIPPSLTGSANRHRSASLHPLPSHKAGINSFRITSSTGCSKVRILSTVLRM